MPPPLNCAKPIVMQPRAVFRETWWLSHRPQNAWPLRPLLQGGVSVPHQVSF